MYNNSGGNLQNLAVSARNNVIELSQILMAWL